MKSKLFLVAALIVIGLLCFASIIPLFASGYVISFLLLIFMYVGLAYSWNIISGFTGYISFGHVAFFGLGGYVVAILTTKCGFHWFAAALLGGLFSAVVALFWGAIMLRLSGVFFAFGMLGLSQILRIIASVWRSLTNGGTGIFLPPILSITAVYYIYFTMAVALLVFTWRLRNSVFGLRLMSIREDEEAARSLGINTTFYKIVAFALSAGLVGVSGGVQTWYISYIDPDTGFSLIVNISMIIMCIFGGAGTVWGPFIGAVVLGLISELFWANFPQFYLVIYGAILVGVIIYMPKGLIEFVTTEIRRIREGPISAFEEAVESPDSIQDV